MGFEVFTLLRWARGNIFTEFSQYIILRFQGRDMFQNGEKIMQNENKLQQIDSLFSQEEYQDSVDFSFFRLNFCFNKK